MACCLSLIEPCSLNDICPIGKKGCDFNKDTAKLCELYSMYKMGKEDAYYNILEFAHNNVMLGYDNIDTYIQDDLKNDN